MTFRRNLIEDDAQRWKEAHIEHPVGLVEHHRGGTGQIDQSPFQIVAETARCRDHHFGPGPDIAQLVSLAHAAYNHGSTDAHALNELPECFIDLNGKFACGAEDQDLYCFRTRNSRESFNHRNRKCQSLARASLGGRHHVTAFHERRDGLRLDGRWSDEFVFREVVPQRGAKIKFGKMLHRILRSVLAYCGEPEHDHSLG